MTARHFHLGPVRPATLRKIKALEVAGKTQGEIAKELGIGRHTVNRAIGKLRRDGDLAPRERRPGESDHVWMLRATPSPDERLYGPLAPAVLKLRKRGYIVVKSETMGRGKGRFVVSGKLVEVDEMVRLAGVGA